MHRFHLPESLSPESPVSLPTDTARQVARVLRMRAGDEIAVFDGSGEEWTVRLDAVGARAVTGRVVAARRPGTEPAVRVVLYQSLIDPAQFELVLQKCTELGVTRFVPLVTERVRGAGPSRASANRLERWTRIVRESAEQSGRVRVPEVAAPVALDDAGLDAPEGPLLVPWEGESELGIREVLARASTETAGGRQLRVVVGPKGGFGDGEVDRLRAWGAHVVSLGTRILRAETAAIATVAAVMYEAGELGSSGTAR